MGKGNLMDDYYKDLGHIQNSSHEITTNVDIMTITGFMNDTQKITHLLRYARLVGDEVIVQKWEKMA